MAKGEDIAQLLLDAGKEIERLKKELAKEKEKIRKVKMDDGFHGVQIFGYPGYLDD
jgi:hypothetical protein